MHQQDQLRQGYTIQQAHRQLDRLAELINRHNICSFQSLAAYVQIYITMQNQSEDFFASFCQHQIVQKVFCSDYSNRDTLKILQLFNFILANTNQLNSIIYIFSQPAFHSFLFERFNVLKETSQAVEYYVQLLKTVIMKMSSGHSSLIKLFCNNRYSSFPMLYQITYLAVNAHEDLVKITAQQCVLLLINLLNRKKVGCGYLSEIQMAIFYHELTVSISLSQKQFEGGLKYLVDLIIALQNNLISLKMLMNAFIINVLFKKIANIAEVLEIVRKFSELMLECQEFPRPIYKKIRLILSRITCNICFGQYINSTCLTAIIKTSKCQIQTSSILTEDKTFHSALMKYFSSRFQKIMPYIEQFDKREESENDLSVILDGWIAFNGSSEINKMKQHKQKSNSSIFSFLSPKKSQLESYLKAVTMSVGINYSSLKYPLFKLSATIDFSTAIFYVQSLLVKQQMQLGNMRMGEIQQHEVHLNDKRGSFQLNEQFCCEIFTMIEKISKETTDIQKQEKLSQFEMNFVIKLKQYLCLNLSDHLLLIQHDYSLRQLSMLNKLLDGMGISEALQRKTAQKLLCKLEQIQLQINDLTFKHDFKGLIRYILNNQYENLLYRNEMRTKQGKSRDSIIAKMFIYEFIRDIVDPSLQSLRHFVLSKWQQHISIESNSQKLKIQKVDSQGRKISIKSNNEIKFKIQIVDEQNEVFNFDVQEQSIFEALYQQECIYFSQYPQGIHFKTKQDCGDFKEEWLKISGLLEETITKWILQFFEVTHNRLCEVIAQKKQEGCLGKSISYGSYC